MITMETLFKREQELTEDELVTISDQLWQYGSIQDVKNHVTPEVFVLQVALNTFGNWEQSGWWGVISEQAELVPHIPAMLESLQLPELRKAFDAVIHYFPDATVFDSDDAYFTDLVNFYQNPRIKLADESLNQISKEERQKASKHMDKLLDELEGLSEKVLYGGEAEDIWQPVRHYIVKHR